MEELPGWKPFRNVDPSMTETEQDAAVLGMEAWLRAQKLQEGRDYIKREAGAWTEFYVREERHSDLVEAYAAFTVEQAGGEAGFNVRNSFKYPQSHATGVRNLPPLDVRPERNPGKRDKHRDG